MKKYIGNGKGYVLAIFKNRCVLCEEIETWELSLLSSNDGYVNFKLYASSIPVCAKANYWIGFKLSTKALARHPDVDRLANRSELKRQLIKFLEEQYGEKI